MKRRKHTLNRRYFTQMAASTGVASALPVGVVPARVASAAIGPSTGGISSVGVSNAKMLWASLLSRTQDTRQLVQVANGFGIPKNAALGACAKLNSPKLIAAHKVASFNRLKPVSALKSDFKRRAKAALEVEADPLSELDEHSPPDPVEVTVLDDGKVQHSGDSGDTPRIFMKVDAFN